jgi:hypothetical protein
MLTMDQMTVALGAVRDQVLAIMRDHEREVHGGEPCWGNRASAVAHLAHCLGFTPGVWEHANRLRHEYDVICRQADCPHAKH